MPTVIGEPLTRVDFSAHGLAAIEQSIRTILATVRGTVRLDRKFGIPADLVDAPLAVVQARYAAEVVAELERREPRIKVTRVTFRGDGVDGKLVPVVQFAVRDGVLL